MPYRDHKHRNAAARRRYALDPKNREQAKARSKRQRQRFKAADDARQQRNVWQRRWRRKVAAKRAGDEQQSEP